MIAKKERLEAVGEDMVCVCFGVLVSDRERSSCLVL